MDLFKSLRADIIGLSPEKAVHVRHLPKQYEAWIVYTGGKIGVAIPCIMNTDFYASFASVQIKYLSQLILGNRNVSVLFLFVDRDSISLQGLRDFAAICTAFVDPGIDGIDRKNLVKNPTLWWENMKNIIGNKNVDTTIYSLLSELIIYEYLLSQHKENINWTGYNKTRVDFITSTDSYEVKSTLQRYTTQISINGQFQLIKEKNSNLHLIFCRLEKNVNGFSVDDILNKIKKYNIDISNISNSIEKLGFPIGSIERKEKFKVLEIREYLVDEEFPSITENNFINGKIPAGITHIEYTIDLEILPYNKIIYSE